MKKNKLLKIQKSYKKICFQLKLKHAPGLVFMENYHNCSCEYNYATKNPKEKYKIILGLPFIEKLSIDEINSVIRHELGHFYYKHGESKLRWIFTYVQMKRKPKPFKLFYLIH